MSNSFADDFVLIWVTLARLSLQPISAFRTFYLPSLSKRDASRVWITLLSVRPLVHGYAPLSTHATGRMAWNSRRQLSISRRRAPMFACFSCSRLHAVSFYVPDLGRGRTMYCNTIITPRCPLSTLHEPAGTKPPPWCSSSNSVYSGLLCLQIEGL